MDRLAEIRRNFLYNEGALSSEEIQWLISEVETKTARLESAMANIDRYEAENRRLWRELDEAKADLLAY